MTIPTPPSETPRTNDCIHGIDERQRGALSRCPMCLERRLREALESREILNEIAYALESRGFAHCCNGKAIGKLLDDLEAAERGREGK